MANLTFIWGCMGAAKTANALMMSFNCKEKGMNALLLKPSMDTRDGKDFMRSRVGLVSRCHHVEDFISSVPTTTYSNVKTYDVVIIDEVQFMEDSLIQSLLYIAHTMDIPVICYGLKDDFLTTLFPMSRELLLYADEIQEMPMLCWCGQKASCNARISKDGTVARTGQRYVLGGNDLYTALCKKTLS